MLKIARILDGLDVSEQRKIAFELYRLHGSPVLQDLVETTAPDGGDKYGFKDRRRRMLSRDTALCRTIRERDEDRCVYCGVLVNWDASTGTKTGSFDHRDPLGPNSLDNVVVACRSCNSSKGRKTPEQFATRPNTVRTTENSAVVLGSSTSSFEGSKSSKKPEEISSNSAGARDSQTALVTTDPDFGRAKQLLEPRDFEFLCLCPEPFRSQWLGDPEWFVSLLDGYPKLAMQEQVSRYMAWVPRKKDGTPRQKDLKAGLRNWFATGDRMRERDEMRQAARRA